MVGSMQSPIYRPELTMLLAQRGMLPRYVAVFDSATTMLRALAGSFHSRHARGADGTPAFSLPLAAGVNRLPAGMREWLYKRADWADAVPADQLGNVRAE